VVTKEFIPSEESDKEDAADHADGNKHAVLAIKLFHVSWEDNHL